MPNRVNQLLLKQYTDAYQSVGSFISVGYEGMNVKATNLLRTRLAERNVRLLFVKNRIVQRAFREMSRPDVAPICIGQSAFVDSEDPVGLARLLVDFQREHKELKIHGAVVEEQVLDEKGVLDLSRSPTKEELKGMIVSQALGPGGRVAGALLGPARTIAGQIKKLVEKLEGKGEAA